VLLASAGNTQGRIKQGATPMNGAQSYNQHFNKTNGKHLATIEGYSLEVPPYWTMLTKTEIDSVDNGCGLATWPAWVRWLFDNLSMFGAAARVHDVEFSYAICPDDITQANKRFFANCRRVAKQDRKKTPLVFRSRQFLWQMFCAVSYRIAVGIGGFFIKRKLKGKD
jgi:hypothetical protein